MALSPAAGAGDPAIPPPPPPSLPAPPAAAGAGPPPPHSPPPPPWTDADTATLASILCHGGWGDWARWALLFTPPRTAEAVAAAASALAATKPTVAVARRQAESPRGNANLWRAEELGRFHDALLADHHPRQGGWGPVAWGGWDVLTHRFRPRTRGAVYQKAAWFCRVDPAVKAVRVAAAASAEAAAAAAAEAPLRFAHQTAPEWSDVDKAALLALLAAHGKPTTTAGWGAWAADHFPGRSAKAVYRKVLRLGWKQATVGGWGGGLRTRQRGGSRGKRGLHEE